MEIFGYKVNLIKSNSPSNLTHEFSETVEVFNKVNSNYHYFSIDSNCIRGIVISDGYEKLNTFNPVLMIPIELHKIILRDKTKRLEFINTLNKEYNSNIYCVDMSSAWKSLKSVPKIPKFSDL